MSSDIECGFLWCGLDPTEHDHKSDRPLWVRPCSSRWSSEAAPWTELSEFRPKSLDRGEFGMPGIGSKYSDGYEPKEQSMPSRVANIFDEAQTLYRNKARGYGGDDADHNDLGLAGQYSDMNRKWKRLKPAMWDGQPWPSEGEPLEEVLMDFMGHCAMTIDFLRNH